jgi:hypothetical protein
MCTSKVGHIFVGETGWCLPEPKNDYQCICVLCHKVGEIDLRAQFHRHSTGTKAELTCVQCTYFLIGCNSKVGHNFGGKTERCQKRQKKTKKTYKV